MKGQGHIGLVFTLIIMLLLGQGIFSLIYLSSIASQAENLYRHPYAVSNAARNININMVSMHRSMKDVALAETETKVRAAAALVDSQEQKVLKNFDLIFERYLGSRADIQVAYEAFLGWKSIRDQVITLKLAGRDQEAADITRRRGADHVSLLNKETQKLIDYADNKAKMFLSNAVKAEVDAFRVIIVLLITAVIGSIVSSYYAVRNLHKAQSEMMSRMHLIDQNILMAKFDSAGIVTDISHHLCRFFEVHKRDVMGEQANFFVTDQRGDPSSEMILKVIGSGKVWEGEIRRINADGTVQWIHSVVHPQLDKNFEVLGFTNIIQDVTDRKSIEELSITDALTGLSNRRYFNTVVEKELRISNRNKSSLIFVVIDIDFFKKYNDHYGHPAGDSALVKVAQALKLSLQRPSDAAFRLGGEEFGILLSDLDAEQARVFLETIRQRIEGLKIDHKESEVCQYVTISLGAYLKEAAVMLDSNQLYINADQALYEAKQSRNAVVLT